MTGYPEYKYTKLDRIKIKIMLVYWRIKKALNLPWQLALAQHRVRDAREREQLAWDAWRRMRAANQRLHVENNELKLEIGKNKN